MRVVIGGATFGEFGGGMGTNARKGLYDYSGLKGGRIIPTLLFYTPFSLCISLVLV